MLRAVALSLIVLFSIAALLPLTYSSAENGRRSAVTRRNKRLRHKRSRAWWRRYRAHLRRKRAAALLRGQKPVAAENNRDDAMIAPNAAAMSGGVYNDPRAPFSLTMPAGWNTRPALANGEAKFRVYAPDGRPVGQATLSVVRAAASADGALSARARARVLGGVPLADLRRTVIDKMIAANGWVINDLVREINGRRVFVVIAQTAASADGRAPQQSWTFYFMETDNGIYSLAASAPLEFSDRMATEAEQVMASFRQRPSPTLAQEPPR